MKRFLLFVVILLSILTVTCTNQKFDYPKTKTVDQVDSYFGVEVEDSYRWLENDRSAETEEWVVAQNKITFDYLAQIPIRDQFKTRLENLWNFETVKSPFKKGDKYFFYKNSGLQNQNVLYVQNSINEEAKVLIDPNNLSEDGTIAMDEEVSISKDGKYIAYQISRGGSDWHEIYVKEIESGKDLEDHIEWVKFSEIAWYKNGFFYSKYPAPGENDELSGVNEFQKIYYHKIGTSASNDEVVFENKEFPLRNYTAEVSGDEKYIFINETESTSGNNLYVRNLKSKDEFTKLTTGFNFDYKVVDQIGDNFIVLTNFHAPRYKLVRINVNTLNVGNWVDVIPDKNYVLKKCVLAGDKIIASYMKDAQSKLEVYTSKGDYLYDIELPAIGSVKDLHASSTSNEVFFTFKSFTIAPTVYKYDTKKNVSEIFFKPELNFDASEYETKQVFYESKDGIKIPMFIVHKKGLKLDGNNPTLLYGYGGFNVSLLPSFKVERLVWLENNGVFAMPNIRGGGEYGENWHKAGTRLNKQNVFDDFIAASEYLINESYTSPDKLAIRGGSNGGLLIGAVINQRPDLFSVAFPEVGVLDMLRYQNFTIGWAWVNEYGSSDDSVQFENLYNYSPLHNIQGNVDYPAVMVVTADHDDRVVPAHSFKYIATLQNTYKGNNPVMIRIQTNAGHSAGKPVSMKINEAADKWAFAFHNMGIKTVNKD
ncbi:MAG: S9 family peptidase [Bacteroidales bacterium]|nr:S9 family peptidase [Bacteroidales bacterium]